METSQIYKCNDCGGVVEVVHPGTSETVCCGGRMELLIEKREDAGLEKHVPVVENEGPDVLVKVGAVQHPMEDAHYIAWVEIIVGGEVRRKYLHPGEEPQAVFRSAAGAVAAREYCTIHGLWAS